EYFIQQSPDTHANALRELLRQMVGYASVETCRQLTLLDYFGDVEETALGPCGQCDRCLATPSVREADADLLAGVQAVLRTVARFHGRFGVTRIAEVLHGSLSKNVLGSGLHTTPSFAQLKTWTRSSISRMIRRLTESGHLCVEGLEFPLLALTDKGVRVLDGSLPLEWGQSVEPSPVPPRETSPRIVSKEPLDHPLFERLRRLRTELAVEAGVAPFVIFHDKTLRHIASMRPSSVGALESIPGIGPAKLERYGRKVLEVVNEEQ
ncbi:MAG: HRDC domain-containing protein, partial [Gammaproteobacteria bacterium]